MNRNIKNTKRLLLRHLSIAFLASALTTFIVCTVNFSGRDNSAWAENELSRSNFAEQSTKTLAELDEELRILHENKADNTEEFEMLLLERELINNLGSHNLKQLYANPDAKETLTWLTSNVDRLRTFIGGGAPDGSWVNAVQVLARIYTKHKDDLKDFRTTTELYNNNLSVATYGTRLSTIYEKMMFSIALTHAKSITSWLGGSGKASVATNSNISDPVLRYEVYKDLLLNKYLAIGTFERLEVEEMRYVMANRSANDEIKWLNNYTTGKNINNAYSIISYNKAGWDTSVWRVDKYYGENRKNFNAKYKLNGYDITNEKYYPKIFMALSTGSICWGVSYTGVSMLTSHGIPAAPMAQFKSGKAPHVAYLTYSMNARGEGSWNLANNAFGWEYSSWMDANDVATTSTKGTNPLRPIAGWENSKTIASKDNATYQMLGQAAINDYDNYLKAKEKVLLAKSYSDDYRKQESLYLEAINIQPIHWDALKGLADLYKAHAGDYDDANDRIYNNLILKITGDGSNDRKNPYSLGLQDYPLPMDDLYNYSKGLLTDSTYALIAATRRNTSLELSMNTSSNWITSKEAYFIYYNKGKQYQLPSLADFSFNDNTIRFNGNNETLTYVWEYSLDGGETWHAVTESNLEEGNNDTWVLTPEEVETITVKNGIKINIMGTSLTRDPALFHTIPVYSQAPIKDSQIEIFNPYIPALKIARDVDCEWRYEGETTWTRSKNIDITNRRNVEVRLPAKGNTLPSAPRLFVLRFKDVGDNEKYLLDKNYQGGEMGFTIIANSANDAGKNAALGITGPSANGASGRLKTKGNVENGKNVKYITIGLERPIYLSRLQTVLTTGESASGMATAGELYYSSDNGATFTKADIRVTVDPETGITDFIPSESIYVNQVKIVVTSVKSGNYWECGQISFFQDTTKITPELDVEYNTTSPTNEDVTATIIPADGITVVNGEDVGGGKKRFLFTENGTKTINYTDSEGDEKTATIVVSWIDKTPINVTVKKNITVPTNGNVTATISSSNKQIQALNPADSFTYVFTENGSFTFKVRDRAGNLAEKTVTVDNIDKTAPTAEISYSPAKPASGNLEGPVTATIKFSEPITLSNDNDLDLIISEEASTPEHPVYTYTFDENKSGTISFMDNVRNEGSAELLVDWIADPPIRVSVEYDNTISKTRENVTATLVSDGEIEVLNNNGQKTYTFYNNGQFTFNYRDTNGNEGEVTAFVDWIDKKEPPYSLVYSRDHLSRDPVTVSLEFAAEAEVELLNDAAEVKRSVIKDEAGNDTGRVLYEYEFKKNGTYIFHYLYTYTPEEVEGDVPMYGPEELVASRESSVPVMLLATAASCQDSAPIMLLDATYRSSVAPIMLFANSRAGTVTVEGIIPVTVALIDESAETPPDDPNKDPDDPTNPDNPNNPDSPNGPNNPSDPNNPNDPSNPSNPDAPNNPSDPNNPSNNPGDPNNPSNPTDPNNPGNSEDGNNPDSPNTPTGPSDVPNAPSSVGNDNNSDDPNSGLEAPDEAPNTGFLGADFSNTSSVATFTTCILSGIILALLTRSLLVRAYRRKR